MNTKIVLRIILAALLGEIMLILLTTVAQAVVVDGLFWNSSSNPDLIIGGLATILAGIISGFIASLVVGKNNNWPHIIISLLITIEMSYLILSGKLTDPLWFDMLSGLILIGTIWVGHYLFHKMKRNS